MQEQLRVLVLAESRGSGFGFLPLCQTFLAIEGGAVIPSVLAVSWLPPAVPADLNL